MDHQWEMDDLTRAAFRLSWPGHEPESQMPDRCGNRLAALLSRALSRRGVRCTGWPVSLSAPNHG